MLNNEQAIRLNHKAAIVIHCTRKANQSGNKNNNHVTVPEELI